jgi:hypothetical protein
VTGSLDFIITGVVFIVDLSPDRTKWSLLVSFGKIQGARVIMLTIARESIDENVAKFNTSVA